MNIWTDIVDNVSAFFILLRHRVLNCVFSRICALFIMSIALLYPKGEAAVSTKRCKLRGSVQLPTFCEHECGSRSSFCKLRLQPIFKNQLPPFRKASGTKKNGKRREKERERGGKGKERGEENKCIHMYYRYFRCRFL